MPLGVSIPTILTKQEAAAFIRCTTRYLERMVKAGRLKAYRPVDFFFESARTYHHPSAPAAARYGIIPIPPAV